VQECNGINVPHPDPLGPCKMKMLILGIVMNVLFVGCATVGDDCRIWSSQVDPAVDYSGALSDVTKLSPNEKIHAINCLLTLEGKREPAKIGGVTRMDVSQVLPKVSVEIASLFYISYIYYGRWDHCNGIALVDEHGKRNSEASVKEAFSSYKKWFKTVKRIGIEKAKEMNLDPMDSCTGVAWY
jgi:hypothetical protein